MALVDTAAQDAALDAWLGAGKAAGVPASFALALFHGDPAGSGTEIGSTGGYARVTVTNDAATWPAAVSGQKSSATITLPAATAAWSDTVTFWALYDGTVLWFTGQFASEVSVDGPGALDPVSLAVYFGTGT